MASQDSPMSGNEALSQQISAMSMLIQQQQEYFQAQIQHLNSCLSHLTSQQPTPQATYHNAPQVLKEPKVATPEKFNGSSKDLKNFIASVENAMQLQPSRFPSEHIKILYIGTLLTGDALTWFRTLTATPDSIPETF